MELVGSPVQAGPRVFSSASEAGLTDLTLRVSSVETAAPLVRSIMLQAAGGEALPGYTPGAHLQVRLPDGGHRCYSLVSFDLDPATARTPDTYRLGVRLDEVGSGGSRFMHALRPGQLIQASTPRNEFQLIESEAPVLFLAGGIGVTPLATMAARCVTQGRAFRFHYSGRSRGQLAFTGELAALASTSLTLHADDEPAHALDLAAVLATAEPASHIYVCGPLGMIDAVIAEAARQGRPRDHIHFEIFSTPDARADDDAFDVVIASSGRTIRVDAGQTILDALTAAGEDPLSDCGRGECGVCQVAVIEGVPDHRDHVLTDAERRDGKVMQICVSRSKSPRLVLDL